MNTFIFDQGTMSGMTDGHFIASVEPLLMTLLEKELFKRLVEHECPGCDVLDGPIDDALYLIDLTSGEAREVATELHTYLITIQKDLK